MNGGRDKLPVTLSQGFVVCHLVSRVRLSGFCAVLKARACLCALHAIAKPQVRGLSLFFRFPSSCSQRPKTTQNPLSLTFPAAESTKPSISNIVRESRRQGDGWIHGDGSAVSSPCVIFGEKRTGEHRREIGTEEFHAPSAACREGVLRCRRSGASSRGRPCRMQPTCPAGCFASRGAGDGTPL